MQRSCIPPWRRARPRTRPGERAPHPVDRREKGARPHTARVRETLRQRFAKRPQESLSSSPSEKVSSRQIFVRGTTERRPVAMVEASDRPAPFVASEEFAGARNGYYFRLGELGLGYYEDVNRRRAFSSLLTEASCSDAHGDTSDVDDSEDRKPTFKVDLFDWYRKRLLCAVGKRSEPLVDTGEVVIRVVSLWPHGAVGVVDSALAESPDDDARSVAVSCDVGVSVEWRAVVTLGDSESVLGSVLGRVKLASAKLKEDGTIAIAAAELLVGGEKSAVERERDARKRAGEEQIRREMADMRVGQGSSAGHDLRAETSAVEATDSDSVAPLEVAAGPKLDDVARDAMRRFGLERVTNVFAQCVADCVAKASGREVGEVEVDAPWVTITSASGVVPPVDAATSAGDAATRLRATRDSDLPASTLAMLRPSPLDRALDLLRECHGATGGPSTVSLAGVELRATHFFEEVLPAVAACASKDAPCALDLSRSGVRDAEVQRLVAALAAGAAPALCELRLAGNDALTAVTDAMLKGLTMIRPDVKVVK